MATEFDVIPERIWQELKRRGIARGSVLFAMYADRNEKEERAENYLFLTDDRIAVLTLPYSGGDGQSRRRKTRKTSASARPDMGDNANGTESPAARTAHNDSSTTSETDGSAPSPATLTEYPREGLARLSVEERTSTSRLVALASDGTCILLATMTNFCRTSAHLFERYGNRALAGEKDISVSPDDLPGANCCPKCGLRYPDAGQKICPRCMAKTHSINRMNFFLKKYRIQLAVAFLTLCLSVAFSVLGPYFSSGFFYDKVLTPDGGFFGQIGLVLGLVIATRALMYVSIMFNNYVTSRITVKMVYDLRKTIFGVIERLSLRFFTGRHTGGLMNQVNDDADAIYEYYCNSLPYFLMCLVQLVIVVVLLFVIQPVMAAFAFAMIPVYVLLVMWQHRRSRRLRAAQYNRSSEMTAHLSDALTGARVVKAFAREDQELARFRRNNERLGESERRLGMFHSFLTPLTATVLLAGNIVTLGYGGYLVIRGRLTYGQLLTFISYVNIAFTPLSFFVSFFQWRAYYANAAARLFEIMDAHPEITEKPDAVHPDIRGAVEFSHVDFSYDKNRRVVEDVSFSVPAGETLGIVGHSGAGKSTIANLLMRLYETDRGEIRIDGINVRDLAFDRLYGSIAIVSQETYIFVGSVLDNIRYARPEATNEEVIAAARIAGAHDFIMRMPDGYETRIGLGKKELSGGEKQRISIARAILRNPKILILDEATAAMDTETERMIQSALSRLTEGKTTIIIAHRLSTLRDADQLIVIESGRVVERGTHATLLAKGGGTYHKLYTLQEEALRSAGIAE